MQDCPTQGDPAFDRKRVRPPIGIPMTRLARSEEGGLVLPDGQTGTLIANEDAFAREILGLPTAAQEAPGAGAQQEQQVWPANGEVKPPLLLLDQQPPAGGQPGGPAAAAAAAPVVKAEPAALNGVAHAPAPAAVAPLLAGEAEFAAAAPMPGASFFALFMQNALLPRGPVDFLRTAFDRPQPLPRSGAHPAVTPAHPVGAACSPCLLPLTEHH